MFWWKQRGEGWSNLPIDFAVKYVIGDLVLLKIIFFFRSWGYGCVRVCSNRNVYYNTNLGWTRRWATAIKEPQSVGCCWEGPPSYAISIFNTINTINTTNTINDSHTFEKGMILNHPEYKISRATGEWVGPQISRSSGECLGLRISRSSDE